MSEYTLWLDEDGFDAATKVYKEKKADVAKLYDPLAFRLEEAEARPAAVAAAKKRVKDIRLLVAKWEKTLPQVTEEERGEVLALCDKAEAWVEEKEAAQAAHASSEAPLFTSAEVGAILKPTAALVTKLSRKPAPKPVANATNTTNATASGNSTAAPGNATAAEGESEAGAQAAEEGAAASEEKAEEKDEL